MNVKEEDPTNPSLTYGSVGTLTEMSPDSPKSSSLDNSEYGTTPPLQSKNGINYVCCDILEAKREAKRQHKPIFCTKMRGHFKNGFHSSALAHPLIIEAVETLFVTVNTEIHSESPVSASAMLEILDQEGTPILPQVGGDLLLMRNRVVLVDVLVKALIICAIDVPVYLQLLLEEESGKSEVSPAGKRRKLDREAVLGVSNCHEIEVKK